MFREAATKFFETKCVVIVGMLFHVLCDAIYFLYYEYHYHSYELHQSQWTKDFSINRGAQVITFSSGGFTCRVIIITSGAL